MTKDGVRISCCVRMCSLKNIPLAEEKSLLSSNRVKLFASLVSLTASVKIHPALPSGNLYSIQGFVRKFIVLVYGWKIDNP